MSEDEEDGKDLRDLRARSAPRRDEIKKQWGDGLNWDLVAARKNEFEKVLSQRGGRKKDWDLDFQAATLRISMKLFQPLVVVGKLVNYAVAVVFLVAAVWFAYMVYDHQTMPVDFLETKVLTPVAVPGGRIEILFDINRRKVCQVDPDWSVFGGDDRKFTFVAQRLEVGGPVGHDPFKRYFDLPKDIAPGLARFRVGWTWICPLNFIDLQFPRMPYDVKDIPFTIKEAGP